jgi:hypothetical protein
MRQRQGKARHLRRPEPCPAWPAREGRSGIGLSGEALGVGAKSGLDIAKVAAKRRQIRFLQQIPDCGTRLGKAVSGIRLQQPGGNAQ